MAGIDYQFEITRLTVGFIGTLAYFMCVKYQFINFELDDPKRNSNAITKNKAAMTFFCLIGGLIPYLMDIRQPMGWFIQGFILRATLSSFWSAAESKENIPGGLESDRKFD